MDKRDSKGRFLPGVTGNPKGRPKAPLSNQEIKDLVNDTLPEVITRLLDLLHSENETIALQAAIVLRDWSSAQPKFEVAGTDLPGLNSISLSYGKTAPKITLNPFS